jgi:hypothetical protein
MDNVWLHRLLLFAAVGAAWFLFEQFGASLKGKIKVGSIGG